MTQSLDFLAPLNDLVVLRISGDDTVDFLHSQLSNDISGIGEHDARLAAYCSPKGRMLGSLVVWRETADAGAPLLALTKADQAEALLKRLRMFVLRAKVVFETTALQAYGAHVSPKPAEASGDAAATGWASAPAPWRVERETGYTRISAPALADGPARWWVIAAEAADALSRETGLPLGDDTLWHAEDIRAGLGWVEQANVELFIPQSLNYDLVGGVSFTKGCYPGQEIVARAHFRGVVKRRALPGHCITPADTVLQAGADIFDAQRPNAPAGRIINAAPDTGTGTRGTGWNLLMEVNLADIGHADFRVQNPEGPAIRVMPLPYPLEVKE